MERYLKLYNTVYRPKVTHLTRRLICFRNNSTYITPNRTKSYLGRVKIVTQLDKQAVMEYNGKSLHANNQMPLIVPSQPVGELLLAEWAGALGDLNRKSAELTSLVYKANDIKTSSALGSQIIDDLLIYFNTDSICFFDRSSEFHQSEVDVWDKIRKTISKKRGFNEIRTSDGIVMAHQSKDNIDKARKILLEMNCFELAAFESLTRAFKSFLLPLALYDKLITVEEAIRAATLETDSQSSRWGIIETHHTVQRLWARIERRCDPEASALPPLLLQLVFNRKKVFRRRISDGFTMEGASTPWRTPKPNPVAFVSTGALPKKHRPTSLRMSLPEHNTPDTPLKKERSKFIAPNNISPFAFSPHQILRNSRFVPPPRHNTKLSSSFTTNTEMIRYDEHLQIEESVFENPITGSSSPLGPSKSGAVLTDEILDDPEERIPVENPFSHPLDDIEMFSDEASNHKNYQNCSWKSSMPNLLDPGFFARMEYFGQDFTSWGLYSSPGFGTKLDETLDSYLDSKYRIMEFLGRGSFSDVFRIKRIVDESYFALKRSKEPFTGMVDRLRRLQEVANMWLIAGKLHCVQIIESWEQNGYLFIVMELCENGSLRDVIEYMIKADVRFTEYQIWQILHQIASGLEYLHRCNVIHLDIKPANIFIDERGTLKIGDFGLSMRIGTNHDPDMEGDKYYMAPETLEGIYEKPADIFSLGLLILELAADVELPSQGASWQNLRHGDYSELSFEDVSDALNNLIKEMTDPEPAKRPIIEEVLQRVETCSKRLAMHFDSVK